MARMIRSCPDEEELELRKEMWETQAEVTGIWGMVIKSSSLEIGYNI